MMTFRIRFLDIRPKKPGHQVRFFMSPSEYLAPSFRTK